MESITRLLSWNWEGHGTFLELFVCLLLSSACQWVWTRNGAIRMRTHMPRKVTPDEIRMRLEAKGLAWLGREKHQLRFNGCSSGEWQWKPAWQTKHKTKSIPLHNYLPHDCLLYWSRDKWRPLWWRHCSDNELWRPLESFKRPEISITIVQAKLKRKVEWIFWSLHSVPIKRLIRGVADGVSELDTAIKGR